LGGAVSFATPAFLGATCEAFETGMPPEAAAAPMQLPPSLRLDRDLPLGRLEDRMALRGALDRVRAALDREAIAGRLDAQYRQACRVLAGQQTRRALDVSREPAVLRERYGSSRIGQGLLLARRLVEAGVTYVLVNAAQSNDWDTHANNFRLLKEGLLPPMDRAVSALLDDLDQRGMLDEVLVLVLTEMGRTPVISRGNAGRDHWTAAYSVLLAGGGLTRGQVLGSTTEGGRLPGSRPVTVPEILATVYHRLGIDPNTLVRDAQQRPVPILPEVVPLRELLA
jgi:uncharacterized protein (DUF1501 family)